MRLPLIPRKLRSRLLLTYLVLTLLGLGGFTLWTGLRLQAATLERATQDLQVQALLVANALYEPLEEWREGKRGRRSSFAPLVRSYAQRADARVTVLDPALRVLISSDAAVPPHVEHRYPEALAARSGLFQADIRPDVWRQESRLFIAAPASGEKGEIEGVVQLSISMAPLYREVRHMWMGLLTAAGVILSLTILASVLLASQVTSPIHRLTTVSEAMATGVLDQYVTPTGPDEMAHLADTFNRMAAQVRDMLARQQAFIANAAHELRSPLASLRLRLDMLQAHSADDPALQQHYVRQMAHEVEQLQRLVDHLLALSSLDEGATGSRAPLDLAPLLYDVADAVVPLAQAAGVRLQVDVLAHLPAVAADADAMTRLIRNLLDNAIRYTPAGGQVTISTATAPPPGVALMAPGHNVSTSGVLIHVVDTGAGIPAVHLPHIFERFYRVDKGRSRRQGGTGLVLALVQAIVAAHDGWVDADSVLGKGSIFTVYLPLSPLGAER